MNADRLEQVRVRLALLPDVIEKKMFGSIGFMVNGKLCVGVGEHNDHVMMVRIGPDTYEEALKREGSSPAMMRGRVMKGYVFLNDDALKSGEDYDYWVNAALAFNSALTKKITQC